MSGEFLPGVELGRRFYRVAVKPLLDRHVPGLRHSAALIGPGSEILGFDSARSTDHNWGPRVQVFLREDEAELCHDLGAMLSRELPEEFLGWPVRFPDVSADAWPVRHRVSVAGLGSWLTGELGFDPRTDVTVADWLATPTQLLAEVTGGAVFHDGLAPAGLGAARVALAWYPDDVWRYVLACQWQRIGQEEAFPGRCAESGDNLGSAIITARLARDASRLAMLMKRIYPPYAKWHASAFARLPGVDVLHGELSRAVAATDWQERERGLCAAWGELARWHNELGLTEPLDPAVRQFYDRPYLVIGAERFSVALRNSIGADLIRDLPLIGAVDQFIDSTDAVGWPALRRTAVTALLKRHSAT
ncbi:MAG TPA: DUF4037 domain-containing protein [Streptosporangiaceae bacterium]|nr:DUF4037 domain-containing protein [Streptosporangiaceae bacterium]